MNNTSSQTLPVWEMWIWSTTFMLESIAIVFTNSITIHIFLSQRKTLRHTSYVVINLALADLSVGLSAGCFGVENLVLSYTGEKPTSIGCLTVDFISECASILFLVVLSLERMHAVFWPLRHRITKTRSYIYIICTAWLFSFTLAITFIISYFGIINQKISTSMFIFFMAVFPLTVCVVYGRIWFHMKHLRKQSIRRHRHIANNNLTKTILVASLLSVTAWLPVSATLLVSVLCKNCLSLNNSSRAVYAARILQFGNSLLNPVIYNIRMPEFRAKLMRLLFRRHSRVSIQSSYLTPGTLPNFATQSATPVLLSLIPLASSSGRINSSIINQERQNLK